MQKLFFPLFCACCYFASGILFAASCMEEQYGTENGTCYPAWYGQTTSGAYYTIAKPEGWTQKDGLVIWNHGFQSFLTGFQTADLLSILNPSWDGYYSGEVQAKPGLGPYAETILAEVMPWRPRVIARLGGQYLIPISPTTSYITVF